MKPIKVGVEIECLVNDSFSICRGDYHRGISVSGLPGWKAENDSSLHPSPEDPWLGETTEFVSKAVTSRDDFFKLLENFQDYFSKKGKLELNKALIFNSSCGSHIHFSLKGMKFTNRTIWKVFRETRNLFIKLVRRSDIKSKDKILSQYYRHYAKRCIRSNYRSGRMSEWNLESEWNNRGIEWRSINLRDIDNWKDFMKLFEIIWTCLNFLGETAEKYTEQRTITIKPELKELKHLKDDSFKPRIEKPESLKDEKIETETKRIFSKKCVLKESKEMVQMRLKHLSEIETVKSNILRISTTDVHITRKFLRDKQALIKGDDLVFPNNDGMYLVNRGLYALDSAVGFGYSTPSMRQTKRLLRKRLIAIQGVSNENIVVIQPNTNEIRIPRIVYREDYY